MWKKIVIVEQKEKQSDCIKTVCNVGFSPSLHKIKGIVWEYVESNKLRTPFKDNRPGKKWVKSFMKHNRMSLKKANMISSAQKSAKQQTMVSEIPMWSICSSCFFPPYCIIGFTKVYLSFTWVWPRLFVA